MRAELRVSQVYLGQIELYFVSIYFMNKIIYCSSAYRIELSIQTIVRLVFRNCHQHPLNEITFPMMTNAG